MYRYGSKFRLTLYTNKEIDQRKGETYYSFKTIIPCFLPIYNPSFDPLLVIPTEPGSK